MNYTIFDSADLLGDRHLASFARITACDSIGNKYFISVHDKGDGLAVYVNDVKWIDADSMQEALEIAKRLFNKYELA